jgi:isopenicillin-N epimerase
MTVLKDLFLLDPTVVFLNHGSFGACPRPVFAAYQEWQRRLERQPVYFMAHELSGYLSEARHKLGAYLNAASDDLVFVPNATFGVNVVARSLSLEPGDEVLTSDHEYGACDRAWRFVCRKRGVRYVRQPIPLPVSDPAGIVEQFWQGVTPRTRIIFLSHITSATALSFPIEAICARARESGILTVIDGAHAPGQIPLDLMAVGPDFYTGNAHKWMMSPKGAAFLYARREAQPLLEPLVVSWGWESETPGNSTFIDHHQWLGTNDPSAYLAVPAAIDFQARHDWPQVRQQCHELACATLARLSELTGLAPVYPATTDFFQQMFVAPLPPSDLPRLKHSLYEEYRVEAPLITWNGYQFIRLSVQGYNTPADMDVLLSALRALLPQVKR